MRWTRTTQSNHILRKYPDIAKSLEVIRSEQLWVSDIPIRCIGYYFNYLSLITDAYSKRVMSIACIPILLMWEQLML